MADTVGRNEPCPCGSGKKYKHCCLDTKVAVDLLWQRMRQAEGRLINSTVEWVRNRYGFDLLDAAWADFTLWQPRPGNPAEQPEFETMFVPWLVFNWVPDKESEEFQPTWPQRPLTLEYLHDEGARLDPFEKRFAEEMCKRRYSFYSVTGTDPGRSISLRDILTHRDYRVLERQASRTVEAGTVIFTRVLEMDGVAIMCGCAPLMIPPHFHNRVIELRENLFQSKGPVSEELLHEYEKELREEYFAIADAVYNPRMPELHNTDGDPFVPTTLHFEIHCKPDEAFEELKSLALHDIDEPVLDGKGELTAVRFGWLEPGNKMHKDWENTVLGSLSIKGKKLTAQVNSEQRAQRVRAEIEQRLGDRVVYKRAVIESIERALEERRNRPETPAEHRQREEHERLRESPEVQEHLKNMLAQHWESWVDTEIPALGNQTPRQAAQTPLGRERLEALLAEFEWRGEQMPDPILRPDVAELRRRLGL
jgi:hypothetical protein